MTNDFKQERQLEYVINHMQEDVKPHADAFMVVGSMAHGRGHYIHSGSDVDAMVVCAHGKIPRILETSIMNNYHIDVDQPLECLYNGTTDLFSVRHMQDTCLFTIHFMDPETFSDKFADGTQPHTLYSYRKVPKHYEYDLKNFAGGSISVPTQNFPIDGGYKVPMETFREVNGKYFMGSPHNKLMAAPRVLIDNGIVTPAIDDLTHQLVDRMLEEDHAQPTSILKALTRYDRIAPDVKEYLRSKEISALEAGL